jgi:hypothetical protein
MIVSTCRLTSPLPVDFAVRGLAPLLVPATSYVPYNSLSSLHLAPAHFLLFLPSLHSRVADIYRAYIAQRILQALGLRVLYHSPVCVRHPHPADLELHSDISAEIKLYTELHKLIDLLDTFTCSSGAAGCLQDLYALLQARGLAQAADLEQLQVWLRELAGLGYAFPALSSSGNSSVDGGK